MNEAPRSVRIAVGLWLAIAVFVLFTTAGLWFQRGEVQRLTNWSSGQVTSFLATLSAVALIFVVAYALLTRLFLRRRNWARIALSFIAIIHMIWILFVGISASNLVTLLLICAAIVFTWQARTAQWLAEVREQ
ncbi:hypothetical protein SAMN04488564_119106 [Lentzea waywayandensis]|uniref:Uncharacterized protein n=1 Tax=Lentzea waywayandensis TaxID=84724 RepID=A0A1I6FHR2_9PSEU|nr:hypothetical protein [Lentzea waywayandensis]SFR29462.1 hypothetical protein SAMN04488564_119106 [Lentzea waywayandensis]